MVHAYIGGIAARSESYMRTHWDHAKALIDEAALLEAAAQEEEAHARVQTDAGLSPVAPALVRWEDLFRPFITQADGVEPGQLTRYFETNTFFRQPHVTSKITFTEDPVDAFTAFRVPEAEPWVLTLPSPWDLALRSRDEHYKATDQLALAYADLLRPFVDAGVEAGATIIRFHDPSAVYARAEAPDVDVFAKALKTAAGGHLDKATLHLTNGDPFSRVEVLNANPLGGLSIENPGQQAPKNLDLKNGLRLSAAVIRGEESLLEDPQEASRRAVELARTLDVELWGVTNGWDLDHVPNAIAAKKIQVLARVNASSKEVVA
jgi:methionine synthase II (cobalamin-independent)